MSLATKSSWITSLLLGVALFLSLFALLTSPSIEEEQAQKLRAQRQNHQDQAIPKVWMIAGDQRVEFIAKEPIHVLTDGNYFVNQRKGGRVDNEAKTTASTALPNKSNPGPTSDRGFELVHNSFDKSHQTYRKSLSSSHFSLYHHDDQNVLPSRLKSRKLMRSSTAKVTSIPKFTIFQFDDKRSHQWNAAMPILLIIGFSGIVFAVKRRIRWYRKREIDPLLHDTDDLSYSIHYSDSPSDVGYGSIVSSSWTGDFDKFDL